MRGRVKGRRGKRMGYGLRCVLISDCVVAPRCIKWYRGVVVVSKKQNNISTISNKVKEVRIWLVCVDECVYPVCTYPLVM